MTNAIQRTNTRLNMSLGIGRMTKGVAEDQNTPTLQACFAGNGVSDNLPFLQHYGFASKPLPGTDIVAKFQSGDRNKGVVIASNDQRYRIKTLKDGEVAIYHKSGSSIVLKEDGSIEINPKNKKTIINSNVEVKGKMDVTGDIHALNMIASDDVTAGSISLKSHTHTNGHNGAPTGMPS